MNLPVLLLPPLREVFPLDLEQLAATPVWLVSPAGLQASVLAAWRGHAVELWLDSADLLLVRRKLPKLPDKRLRQALPGTIEDLVVGDVAAMHCTVGPDDSQDERWIAAVPRSPLEALLKALHTAQVDVRQVATPALALPEQPGAMVIWNNPRNQDEVRWAARVGGDLLGGDAALAEALGVDCLSGPGIQLAERQHWNLIEGMVLDLPGKGGERFARVQAQLAPFKQAMLWLLLPLLAFMIGLGLDTGRLALEKQHLAGLPTRLYESLYPGQPVVMDARLLLRHQLDLLLGQSNPGANSRQLLPLLDAAARLRQQLPGQPLPSSSEFASGQLVLKFSLAPSAQPRQLDGFSVQWRNSGREALIGVAERK